MKSTKSNKSRNHHCSGKLTHFGPTFHFYTPWKCRLTLGLDACKSVKKTPIFYMYYCFGKGFHIWGCSPLDLPLISSDEFDINASLVTHKLENLRSTLEFKILKKNLGFLWHSIRAFLHVDNWYFLRRYS